MDVKHVARLANLPLTPSLEKKLEAQFVETLKTVDVIGKLDTKGVNSTVQINPDVISVLREDVIDLSRIIKLNGFVKVKAIFGNE